MKFRSFTWRDVSWSASAVIAFSLCATSSAAADVKAGLAWPAEQSAVGPAFLSQNIARAASGTVRILHSFGTTLDGAYPDAGLIVVDGTLYGTTSGGGAANLCGPSGCGTVFKMTTPGQERVLFRFNGTDGYGPVAGLIALGGVLYGTTYYSFSGAGTVFSVTSSGQGHVLHTFTDDPDGAAPTASLIDVRGVLYGTTTYGGYPPGSGNGTVFEISNAGDERIVYSFGFPDGLFPEASLVDGDGALYGTTYGGGASGCGGRGRGQCGTVFKVTPGGKETILYRFAGGSDGSNPSAALIDVGGDLYGTTTYGGGTRCKSQSGAGCGTVFKITKGGTESVVYRFAGREDGEYPEAPLINVGGALYGTTSYGGLKSSCGIGYECGTVLRLRRAAKRPSSIALPASRPTADTRWQASSMSTVRYMARP